jgi:putative serine protease PepD
MQTKRARSRRWIPLGAALLAAGAVGSATAFLTAATLSSTATTVQETVVAGQDASLESSSSPSAIYAADSPGVVDITATTSEPGPFGRTQSAEAEGSGFVVDSSGHIVTNAHVVEGASSITVTFSDGTKASATLVGSDESTDIAVLDVDVTADELHVLTLGDSSAVGREIQAPNGSTISNVIQTDAAINSGNSGGPLIDANGHVIGVNAQISSSSGGSDGVGFAIPSKTVKQVVERMLGVDSL